ncbi:conserved membrane protein of unknown function [Candidatus Promineifilum breve]|uniref:DUF4332 domain-containing protein n=1 Tax=Candidatus Promineifilum breve TaxID=1806508 RepID=A0A160SY44_9CHLR|nr:DUF4332 domain-containing protein [Candidatus Promineifilum breve]CUS01944.2 conserved membrane protein of unknown function [Candidatus Promineifilum breve]
MKFLIALLTAATGLLHILVGFGWLGGGGGTMWMLVLNGVGYLVLLALYWTASGSRGTIRWILLIYTLITLVGYFIIGAGFSGGTIPLVIKAIELLLIILLFLDRGSDRVAVQPAPATRMAGPTTTSSSYSSTRTVTAPTTDVAMTGMAAGAAAGTSSTATGAAGVAGAAAAAAALDDRVDYAVDRTLAASGQVGNVVEEGIDDVGYATTDMGDRVGTVVDTVQAEAAGAYDAVSDKSGSMADTAGDMLDDTGDAIGDAVDYVGDKAHDAYDAAGDALSGGLAAIGAAVAGVAGDTEDVVSRDAAAIDAANLAAEPSPEELRADLENYLRSFGSGSEFRKEIEYIEGIGAVYGQKLRAVGVSTVLDLMVNGATRRGRKHISDQSGISQSMILTWVNHVDLFRIKGVAQEYADLLEQSGVDTVVELAQRNPSNLHKRMVDINEQKKLVRRLPHASEVQSWVEQAKNLRRVVHY